MIKNIPIKDEVMYGRLRDIIAVVVEGLEVRGLDMTIEQEDYFAGLIERNLKEVKLASVAFTRLQSSLAKVMDVLGASVP